MNKPTAVDKENIENFREKLTGVNYTMNGDHHNCRCPHPNCGKGNNYVTYGVEVTDPNEIVFFEKPCVHCGRTIFYQAELVIKVKARAPRPEK